MAGDHSCRICGKSFPSGRSLGGHMRSHVLSIADEPLVSSPAPAAGYGLRENRRKTWRLSDVGEKLCRDCGKGFPSWNSLFGHMRCHSDKVRILEDDDEERQSENEPVPRRRKRSRRVAAIPASSSSISDLEKEQQEDVAYSLMKLSRDVAGLWYSDSDLNSNGEYEIPKPEEEFDSDVEIVTPAKKTKAEDRAETARYECSTCKKGFSTYQALGGHRASHHKKMKSTISETSMDTDSNGEINAEVKRVKSHECPVCHKMFVSGQALGGHKRSHMIQHQQQEQVRAHEMIDLNLPAPVDEASGSGSTTDGIVEFKPWWMGHTQKLVGVNLFSD